ncbi:putative mobile pathogenicity island [Kordia sp. SMS9]|uniref:choice-of-anchor Q domain-containing protein n=1 Tax=Kordia sp. SMS9 TaxID=2282170 RepID=UPI000E0D5BEE|nr:choice-of-anchor Q domain-containing protein [Kordia sp. SMS9]AXG68998.1 putative mobile pathogenicity island [Kordia sp. SMS9]
MKTNTPKKSISIKILLLLVLVGPLVQSQNIVPITNGMQQNEHVTIENATTISNGATSAYQTEMTEAVIYQATAASGSVLAIPISAPNKNDATRIGDVVTLDGTNRLLTNITVNLFHNPGDALQPVTLYVSIFDQCAATGVSGSPCTEGNNLLLEGSISYTPPASGAYTVDLNIDPTQANLYPVDDEITVMFQAVSNANVFVLGNVPVTVGADPFLGNGGITLCGPNITSSGCNLAVPDWNFNNMAFSLSAIGDTTPPTAICKDITVTLPNTGTPIISVPVSAINDGSFDNAGGDLSLFFGASGFTTDILLGCGSIGDNPVTLRVVDEAGNESTCTATITVEISPIEFNTGSCLPLTLIANCDAGILYTPPIVTATQICETVTVTQIGGPVGTSFLPIGSTVFSYRALSSSGEERFCSSIVTVVADNFDTVYVDAASTGTGDGASWTNAFTDLQPAIDLATSCANVTEIRVASGTYLPTEHPDGTTTSATDRNNAFHLDTDVIIKGSYNPSTNIQEYSNPSILSGDFNGNDIVTGAGASLTIANNSENAYHVFITTGLSNATVIDGLNIEGGNANSSSVSINYSGKSFFAGYGGGMYNDTSSPSLSNITFSGNSAVFSGGGMYNLLNSSLLTNTVFTFNSAQLGGGMYNDSSSPSIINGTFYGNFASANGGGMRNIVNTSPTIIENTVLYGNSTDIENSASGSVSGANNFSENFAQTGFTTLTTDPFTNSADPDGVDNLLGTVDDGLVPAAGSPLIDAGNSSVNTQTIDITGQARINESAIDVGAYERTPCAVFNSIIYVDAAVTGGMADGSSWANALTDLQPALDLAICANVTEIRVASGIYFPTEKPVGGSTTATNRDNAFHLDTNIILKGSYNPITDTQEYNNPSILSGDYSGNDVITGSGNTLTITGNDENVYSVFISVNLSNATIIDGFTIKGGNANLVQGYTYNSVLFFRNNGGGLQNRQSSPSLTNMVFTSNSALGGGGILNGNNASLSLTNTVFAFNTASFGGGISNSASLNITNATFYGNRATSSGGGIGNGSNPSSANLNNTVFYGNTTDIDNTSSGSILGANNFSEDFTGAGFTLLTADPFTNSADIDGVDNLLGTEDDGLVPAANSVLVDAGNSSLNTEVLDITGNLRIKNNTIDVGAYETKPCPSSNVMYVDASVTSGTQDGSSWANAFTDLQQAIDQAIICATITEIRVASGIYLPTEKPDGSATTATDRNNAFHLDSDVIIKGSYNPTTDTQEYNNPSILSGDFNGDDVIAGAGSNLSITNNTENAYHVMITTGLSNAALIDGFIFQRGFANGGSITYSGQNFSGNSGGGMSNVASSVTVTNTVFVGNRASFRGGGMYNESASPQLINAVFAFNLCPTGGALYNGGASPSITNSTFYGNRATSAGGGIRNALSASATLNNSVLYNNSTDIENVSGGTITGTNNFSEDFTDAGFTLLTTDPFTNSADIDGVDNLLGTEDDGLVPAANSVLIDAGNSSLNTEATDITGQIRIQDSAIDVGAYETDASTLDVTDFDVDISNLTLYPNPATRQITVVNDNNLALQKLEVYDITGRLVNTVHLKNTTNTISVDVSYLNAGTYFIKLTADEGTTTKKLIKK